MKTPCFDRALDLARRRHAGQLDKAGQPYIGHPERVASGFEDDFLKTVAILHDLVEDTETTLTEIEQEFGHEVAAEVDALTRRGGEVYMDYVKRCAGRPAARQVKKADLKDNLDLSRLPEVLAQDIHRVERYREAMEFLLRWEGPQ